MAFTCTVLYAQQEIYTNRLAIGIAVDADDAASLAQIAAHGGNLEQRNLFGLTPLMEAAADGSVRCAQFLIKHGVSLQAKSMDGFTAAYYAVYLAPFDPSRNDETYLKRRAEVLKLLIQAGANMEQTVWPVCGFRLVHIASLSDNLPSLEALAAAGADLNAVGSYGETPLMVAAQHDHLDIVKFLVKEGVDMAAETVAGQNALDYAQQWPKVVAYLKSVGAPLGTYATQMMHAFGHGSP